MIELIQFPWNPFCIVQRRILEFSGARFKITNIPSTDRSLVWRLTRHRYYIVPIIRDGRTVVFETDEDSQVIAKYLDAKLDLALFPHHWEGLQDLIWCEIEGRVEECCFKLNDACFEEFVPEREQVHYIRHKERKFGRGCLSRWREQQSELLETLTHRLVPFEQMLSDRPFLLEARPHFIDFDLFGMLGNFLFSGHYALPSVHSRLKLWYDRMSSIKSDSFAREKLHT